MPNCKGEIKAREKVIIGEGFNRGLNGDVHRGLSKWARLKKIIYQKDWAKIGNERVILV